MFKLAPAAKQQDKPVAHGALDSSASVTGSNSALNCLKYETLPLPPEAINFHLMHPSWPSVWLSNSTTGSEPTEAVGRGTTNKQSSVGCRTLTLREMRQVQEHFPELPPNLTPAALLAIARKHSLLPDNLPASSESHLENLLGPPQKASPAACRELANYFPELTLSVLGVDKYTPRQVAANKLSSTDASEDLLHKFLNETSIKRPNNLYVKQSQEKSFDEHDASGYVHLNNAPTLFKGRRLEISASRPFPLHLEAKFPIEQSNCAPRDKPLPLIMPAVPSPSGNVSRPLVNHGRKISLLVDTKRCGDELQIVESAKSHGAAYLSETAEKVKNWLSSTRKSSATQRNMGARQSRARSGAETRAISKQGQVKRKTIAKRNSETLIKSSSLSNIAKDAETDISGKVVQRASLSRGLSSEFISSLLKDASTNSVEAVNSVDQITTQSSLNFAKDFELLQTGQIIAQVSPLPTSQDLLPSDQEITNSAEQKTAPRKADTETDSVKSEANSQSINAYPTNGVLQVYKFGGNSDFFQMPDLTSSAAVVVAASSYAAKEEEVGHYSDESEEEDIVDSNESTTKSSSKLAAEPESLLKTELPPVPAPEFAATELSEESPTKAKLTVDVEQPLANLLTQNLKSDKNLKLMDSPKFLADAESSDAGKPEAAKNVPLHSPLANSTKGATAPVTASNAQDVTTHRSTSEKEDTSISPTRQDSPKTASSKRSFFGGALDGYTKLFSGRTKGNSQKSNNSLTSSESKLEDSNERLTGSDTRLCGQALDSKSFKRASGLTAQTTQETPSLLALNKNLNAEADDSNASAWEKDGGSQQNLVVTHASGDIDALFKSTKPLNFFSPKNEFIAENSSEHGSDCFNQKAVDIEVQQSIQRVVELEPCNSVKNGPNSGGSSSSVFEATALDADTSLLQKSNSASELKEADDAHDADTHADTHAKAIKAGIQTVECNPLITELSQFSPPDQPYCETISVETQVMLGKTTESLVNPGSEAYSDSSPKDAQANTIVANAESVTEAVEVVVNQPTANVLGTPNAEQLFPTALEAISATEVKLLPAASASPSTPSSQKTGKAAPSSRKFMFSNALDNFNKNISGSNPISSITSLVSNANEQAGLSAEDSKSLLLNPSSKKTNANAFTGSTESDILSSLRRTNSSNVCSNESFENPFSAQEKEAAVATTTPDAGMSKVSEMGDGVLINFYAPTRILADRESLEKGSDTKSQSLTDPVAGASTNVLKIKEQGDETDGIIIDLFAPSQPISVRKDSEENGLSEPPAHMNGVEQTNHGGSNASVEIVEPPAKEPDSKEPAGSLAIFKTVSGADNCPLTPLSELPHASVHSNDKDSSYGFSEKPDLIAPNKVVNKRLKNSADSVGSVSSVGSVGSEGLEYDSRTALKVSQAETITSDTSPKLKVNNLPVSLAEPVVVTLKPLDAESSNQAGLTEDSNKLQGFTAKKPFIPKNAFSLLPAEEKEGTLRGAILSLKKTPSRSVEEINECEPAQPGGAKSGNVEYHISPLKEPSALSSSAGHSDTPDSDFLNSSREESKNHRREDTGKLSKSSDQSSRGARQGKSGNRVSFSPAISKRVSESEAKAPTLTPTLQESNTREAAVNVGSANAADGGDLEEPVSGTPVVNAIADLTGQGDEPKAETTLLPDDKSEEREDFDKVENQYESKILQAELNEARADIERRVMGEDGDFCSVSVVQDQLECKIIGKDKSLKHFPLPLYRLLEARCVASQALLYAIVPREKKQGGGGKLTEIRLGFPSSHDADVWCDSLNLVIYSGRQGEVQDQKPTLILLPQTAKPHTKEMVEKHVLGVAKVTNKPMKLMKIPATLTKETVHAILLGIDWRKVNSIGWILPDSVGQPENIQQSRALVANLKFWLEEELMARPEWQRQRGKSTQNFEVRGDVAPQDPAEATLALAKEPLNYKLFINLMFLEREKSTIGKVLNVLKFK